MSVLDPVGANLPVSAEYCFARSWGLQLGYGIPFNSINGYMQSHFLDRDLGTQHIHKDAIWQIQLRKYVHARSNFRGFVGFELISRKQDILVLNGGFVDDRLFEYGYKSADIKKIMDYYGAFAGSQVILTGNLFFEWHAGFGVLATNNSFSNIEGISSNPIEDKFDHFGVDNTIKYKGNSGWLYPSLGVNIVYLIGRQ